MRKTKKVLSLLLTFTLTASLTLTSLASGSTVSAATNGLMLKYDFNEGGGDVANDSSGNGLHGTLQGAATTLASVEGKNFGGLSLSGANDSLVRIPNDLFKDATVTDITVSINVNLAAAANGFVYSLGSGGNTGRLVGLKLAGNTLEGYYNNNFNGGASRTVRYTEPSGFLNKWTNVTFVASPTNSTIKLYVDGVLRGTTNGAIAPLSGLYDSTKTFAGYIGESYWTGDPNINGSVDDFRVYNYAMTDQQIADLMAVTAINTGESTASTAPGVAPQLPKYATVNFSDSSTQQAEVIWPAIDSEDYASPGQFDVAGATKYGGLPATAHVYVLEAPVLELDTKDTESITLKWPARTGANKYTVYRSETAGSSYTQVFDGNALTFTDTGLSMNKTYYYYMNYTTAIATSSNSAELAVKTAVNQVGPPSEFYQGTTLYPNRIELGWKTVPYADGYNIYRSDSIAGTYTRIAENTRGIIYRDRDVTWGKTYFYKIASVNDAGEGTLSSPIEARTLIDVIPSTVLVINGKTDSTVTLKWQSMESQNALSYTLSRSETQGSGYTEIYAGPGTSFTDTELTAGKKYYYIVTYTSDRGISEPSTELSVTAGNGIIKTFNTEINNTETFLDTEGNPIQAHGGGFLKVGDTYYWVGEDKSNNSAVGNPIHLYSSKDLENWTNEGLILSSQSKTADGRQPLNHNKLERPKLLYNELTGKYVLWVHYETTISYSASEVIVATADHIKGPYVIEDKLHFRPGAGNNDPEAFGDRLGGGIEDWDAKITINGIDTQVNPTKPVRADYPMHAELYGDAPTVSTRVVTVVADGEANGNDRLSVAQLKQQTKTEQLPDGITGKLGMKYTLVTKVEDKKREDGDYGVTGLHTGSNWWQYHLNDLLNDTTVKAVTVKMQDWDPTFYYLYQQTWVAAADKKAINVTQAGTKIDYMLRYPNEKVDGPFGLDASETVETKYEIVQTQDEESKFSALRAPVIHPGLDEAANPDSGAVLVNKMDLIFITEETRNAQVYYTTDGSDPTTSSTRYWTGNGQSISAGNNTHANINLVPAAHIQNNKFTVKAIAYGASGSGVSDVVSVTFQIAVTEDEIAKVPTFKPVMPVPAGKYAGVGYKQIQMWSPTFGAEVYYTVDGGEPVAALKKKGDNIGYGSRDLTVYQDPKTGKAYLITAQDHIFMRVWELNEEFTDVDPYKQYNIYVGMHREAPALVRTGEWVYLFTSSQSGWSPNQGQYARTMDIANGFESKREFEDGVPESNDYYIDLVANGTLANNGAYHLDAPSDERRQSPGYRNGQNVWSELQPFGDNTNYRSQPTKIFDLGTPENPQYIFMGDRWNEGMLSKSTYTFYPLTIDSDKRGPLGADSGLAVLSYSPKVNIEKDENGNLVVVDQPWEILSKQEGVKITSSKSKEWNLPVGAPSGSSTEWVTSPEQDAAFLEAIKNGVGPNGEDPRTMSYIHFNAEQLNDGVDWDLDTYDKISQFFMGTGFPYWIQYELPEPAKLDWVGISNRLIGGSEGANRLVVTASLDGEYWDEIVDYSQSNTYGYQSAIVSGVYKYIKLTILGNTKGDWASGVYEFTVAGEKISTDLAELDNLIAQADHIIRNESSKYTFNTLFKLQTELSKALALKASGETTATSIALTVAALENAINNLFAQSFNLTATAGNATVNLNWGAVTGADSYSVKRSETAEGTYTTVAEQLTGTEYEDTSVVNGTTYYYLVSAVNGVGESAASNVSSATPAEGIVVVPPAAPANLTASAGNAVVNLSWGTVTEATYYSVKRSESAEGDYTTVAAQVVGTNYVDTSVVNGTAYYYMVTAGNSAGESDNSNVISATPAEKAAKLKLTAAQGSAIGTTSVTTNVNQSGDTFKVKVVAPEATLPATPNKGDAPPLDATDYTLENNISGVNAGSMVLLYELDANGNIVAYGKVELTKWDIRVSFPDNGGSNPGPVTPPVTPPVEPEEEENTLQVDADWAAESLADDSQTALTIDLKDIAIGANGSKSAVIPAEVVKQAREVGKPIALNDGGAEWIIPLDELESDEDLTLSISHVKANSGPTNTKGKALYNLTAFAGEKELTKIGAAAVVKLPIPADVKDADKLAVYKKSANGSWVYAGGRAVDGKLVVNVDDFGEYLVVESTKTFVDISGHWSQRAIEVMAARQVANGVAENEFAPNSTVTRAEFAALLTRILKLEGVQASFSDVPSGAWYEEEVGAAAAAGIIKGDGDAFRPQDAVTRQEMAVMILRAYIAAGGQVSSAGTTPFTDTSNISSWAEEAVAGVYSLGIIEGRPDGSFNPSGEATRAEGLTMLMRLMDKAGL